MTIRTLLAASAFAGTFLSTAAMAERANICAELSSYVVAQEKPKDQGAPAAVASAVQPPAKDGSQPAPAGNDPTQKSSGLSGPVTHGGSGASGPQGQAQENAASAQANPKAEGRNEPAQSRPAQQAAQPAPAPAAAAPPAAPPPSPEALAAAQTAIGAKDELACRDAAQKMRRAGVSLPAALMALAALDPKLVQSSPAPAQEATP